MFADFNKFSIKMTKEQAKTGSHQGKCDEDVEYLLTLPEIKKQLKKISDEDLRSELYEYGAWSLEELENRSDNESRIIWISAGSINNKW